MLCNEIISAIASIIFRLTGLAVSFRKSEPGRITKRSGFEISSLLSSSPESIQPRGE